MEQKNQASFTGTYDAQTDERPVLPKIEKDYSYFDSCKSLMKEIERTYRFAFYYTLFIAFIVSISAPVSQRFQVFSEFAFHLGEVENFTTIFFGGVSQILVALLAIVIGYLAWANIPRLNMLMFLLYAAMCLLGVLRADLRSIILGIPGAAMYIRAMLAMVENERISQLEGYPYFNERFQLSKDDFEKPPLRPDSPQQACYMEGLTDRTLRGEQEVKVPIQKKEEPILHVEALSPLEEVLCDKSVYTQHQPLPTVSEISLGEDKAEPITTDETAHAEMTATAEARKAEEIAEVEPILEAVLPDSKPAPSYQRRGNPTKNNRNKRK